MALIRALACLILTAPSAWGGAWPREAGTSFTSVATRYTLGTPLGGSGVTTSLHTEYGLTARHGLVVEMDLTAGKVEKLLAFATYSLAEPDTPLQLGAAIGGGSLSGDPAISPRLSLGRGFRAFGRSGWAEATLSAEFNLATGGRAGKLDLTLGLSPSDRIKSYVQLFAYKAAGGEPYLRVESSVAWNIFGATWIDAGVSTGITPVTDRRIKLGLWMSF